MDIPWTFFSSSVSLISSFQKKIFFLGICCHIALEIREMKNFNGIQKVYVYFTADSAADAVCIYISMKETVCVHLGALLGILRSKNIFFLR